MGPDVSRVAMAMHTWGTGALDAQSHHGKRINISACAR
ncbi:hypothetical protein OCU_18190 [Mycobacterium intracellulare ATCC 13950]|uniref:Uncharacterized protein n=1 Tax=Mycobacterium intracellulare (strain ATCC 13950 / DSM 43223 / JCM 6384 / NCTC 13025 / 3600) TaxID=487521 RepID=H8IQC6_MYCIA|nr:hypothetical protein OCU_18190 [Mycobacterium intracellulare ATCC 13950]ETZ37604.1 hypothetical protein L843_2038 [Mycobacterium intracellulare MIN_061107_1834]